MSAKWRALQHRHRYTYSAIVFPTPFTSSLSQSTLSQSCPKFYSDLEELVSLNSTYAQVNHAKRLVASFGEVLSKTNENEEGEKEPVFVREAIRFYLEVLFMENSQPLHRTLVSSLAKTRKFHSVISSCFRELCDEYGGGKRFCVSRVALSVMGMPKLGYLVDIIEDCAVLVGRDVVSGLNGIVLETEACARPPPAVMEQCQEALSCSYYLFQRFPLKFKGLVGEEDASFMEKVFAVQMRILKSTAFSRDCCVAAGVSFCAALQVCLEEEEELGLFIAQGMFCWTGVVEFTDIVGKIPFDGDICSEISSFSSLSRLCLIRGILTAVSRGVLVSSFSRLSDDHKTILYDGILPELCDLCENPIDSHLNFHALTVMQICLQQIKMSTLNGLAEDYDPMPDSKVSRVLKIIWNNLEDPLSQTVKQVHLMFDLLLDIQTTVHQTYDKVEVRESLLKIVSYLLRLGSRCKGRYVPLASLTRRLGAKTLLDMSPNLLFEMANAYIDDDVCCAVTSFIKCFLEMLRDECWGSEGVEQGYALYRQHCLPPFLYGLASGMSKLRSNLNTYAVQVLLELDVDCIFPLLGLISVGPSEEETKLVYTELSNMSMELTVEQKVTVLVSLLKVCRTLAFLEGDIEQKGSAGAFAFVRIKGIELKVPVEWLKMALTHVDESVRVDAAETLFLNPKTASLPSPFELYLIKEAVPLNMRSSSTGFQMKWTSLFRKFFSRVRTSLEKQYKLGSWQPRVANRNCEKGDEDAALRAESLFKFMRWLSSFLSLSCYPSAPYRRKIMATELIQIMIEVWPIVPSKEPTSHLYPYCDIVTSHDSTLLLVGSIVDSWDRLRENAFRILLHFPTPFTGVSSEDMVQTIIPWAKHLVCSPRVRESDAGALTLRLLFRKYVLDLGWIVKVSTNVVCSERVCEGTNGFYLNSKPKYPVVEYIKSLIHWLDTCVKEGERDLSEACKNSFVHGVLLALRYTFEELDWNSNAVLSSMSEMREELEKLLKLVTRITTLALWVVSADALCLDEDMDDIVDDDNFLSDVQDDTATVLSKEQKDTHPKPVQETIQSEQVVMVGCWLAMKEVSLLLGTIIRKIPLPTSSLAPLENGDLASAVPDDSVAEKLESLLDLKQLEKIGDHFLEVLLKMKHHGAIDKTRAGFSALCHRLLCSNDPRLCKLTESWMEQLMERTVAKGQTVDDLLRRSAGIPAAFIAMFLSEPEGSPKKLLPHALKWLIGLAEKPLMDDPVEQKGSNMDEEVDPSTMHPSEKLSKVRDEGVVPTVHAFNVLKAAFNDTNLGTDTSGFSAEAMTVAIRSFSSPYWEVRNSATLAYTALLRRMVGFLNVQKRGSARRGLTGLEFFHRYPLLHPFIYGELKAATDMLDTSGPSSDSNLVNHVHPSLWPILILLSRLKPSPIASESGDDLDPFVFMPFIMKCSTQSTLRVRVLASRALVGLVSNEKLQSVLLSIASALPSNEVQGGPFNYLHGVLLQLGNLLDTNCRDLADDSKKDQIIEQLVNVLAKCTWMASPLLCPCPIISTSFLRVLDHMRAIGWTCSESKNLKDVYKLHLDLSTSCLDTDASYGFSYYDPTIAELREQAAVSYFGCVFQPSDEAAEAFQITQRPTLQKVPEALDFPDLKERLLRCISDQSYEVRLATLKWFLQFLKSEDSSFSETSSIWHWANNGLQVVLLDLLEKEKNHRCENYILKIFCQWNLLMFKKASNEESVVEGIYVGSLSYDSVIHLWGRLTSLYESTRHVKTRGTLMSCLAICVKHLTGLFFDKTESEKEEEPRWSCVIDCVSYFVNLVKEKSSSAEQVSVRQASAEAIIASGILEQAKLIGPLVSNHDQTPSPSKFQNACDVYAYHILEMWFTCIKLLEDEDDLIRSKLATDVQKCFFAASVEVPTQVEKVLELSFDHLSSVFGHWNEYFLYLSRWVFNTAYYTSPLKGGSDLVRRVFDKEIDNHHEEKLLILQFCCDHLQKLANRDLPQAQLLEWRSKFQSKLLSFAKDHVGKQRESWVGGVGNHKDVFLPLYGNLLGLYVFSNCIFRFSTDSNDKKTMFADMVELGEALKPFLRNPLVSNMFRVVVRLHEKSMDDSLVDLSSVLAGEIWEGFDPYFLLR